MASGMILVFITERGDPIDAHFLTIEYSFKTFSLSNQDTRQ
jgi:hypothetical protein